MSTLRTHRPRLAVLCTAALIAGGTAILAAPAALADGTNCIDGSSPVLGSTVTCDLANNVVLTVPVGTTYVTLDVIGAGGGASSSADGGNPAELDGLATLPTGTAYLRVVTGNGGTTGFGGSGAGGSSVAALDSSQNLLGLLVVAGAGGSAGYTNDSAGQASAGKNANSTGAAAAVGTVTGGTSATGGAGGVGGTGSGNGGGSPDGGAGQNASVNSDVPVAGGASGFMGTGPVFAVGGSGGGGYAGGGGGAGAEDGSGGYSGAGGGGGSSYASEAVSNLSTTVTAGGGSNGTNGAAGVAYVTFNSTPLPPTSTVPSVPVNPEYFPGYTSMRVFFHKPMSDGGSPILGYRISINGGATWSAPLAYTGPSTGPYWTTVTGLQPGRTYQVRMQAWNANGYGGANRPPAAVTTKALTVPSVPVGTEATATASKGQIRLFWHKPADDGGTPILGYRVSLNGGASWSGPLTVYGPAKTGPYAAFVNGLVSGKTYQVRMQAWNKIGYGGAPRTPVPVTPR